MMGSQGDRDRVEEGEGPRTSRRVRFPGLIHFASGVLLLLATTGVPRASAQMPSEEAPPAGDEPPAGAPPAEDATTHLAAAYRARTAGDVAEARVEFERALELGSDPQRIQMELGYLEAGAGNLAAARSLFERAAEGPDPALAHTAERELAASAPPASAPAVDDATTHLEAAYRARTAGDVAEARVEFERALELGSDPQRIQMELGYLESGAGNLSAARSHFDRAAEGPDPTMARSAGRELAYLPTWFWGDLYVEAFGWHRFVGQESTNLVPTLRLRALLRPFLSRDLDFSFYAYGQVTRDLASRDATASALPLLYADNHAMLGGGALLRILGGHLGLYAQVGPAFNLIEDGRDRVSLDARVGIMGGAESDHCRVPAITGVRGPVGGCLEVYGEVTYVSRFHDDVIGMVRGRAGYGLLLTGPVLWQPLIEVRALGARNGDFYNNFAEVGVGHRWRLLEPFVLDLIATLHGGAFYGVSNVDPLPTSPVYLEARLLLVTYVELR